MNSKSKLLIGSSLAAALALAVWTPVQAQPGDATDAPKLTDSQLAERCTEMKALKLKMREDCKAQDARLTDQLAAMNSAADDKKLGLMATLVTNMVEQRIAMDARRASMSEGMMRHMMQHMQAGKDSVTHCPMCNGDGDKPSTDPK